MTATTAVLTDVAIGLLALAGAHYLDAELEERRASHRARHRFGILAALVVPLAMAIAAAGPRVNPRASFLLEVAAILVGWRTAIVVGGHG